MKSIKSRFYKAFSYNELLLSVAIIAILSAMSAPYLLNSLTSNQVEQTSRIVGSFLRSSQQYSIDGIENGEWGVCMVDGEIIQYLNSCIPADTRQTFIPEPNISITGLENVLFERYTGELSSSVSITITDGIESRLIEINEVGGYEID